MLTCADRTLNALDVRQSHVRCQGDFRTTARMSTDAILEALRRLGVPHDRIAQALNRDRTAATKMMSGRRSVKLAEIPALQALIAEYEVERGETGDVTPAESNYMSVEVLPSFAGMGGGGSGEGDRQEALIPRSLIEDELKARPTDLILIEARGESMAPDFLHGDQILIDKRDRNPVQPGAFALWDGDGYVVKLIERVPQKRGFYRIFSVNNRFSAYEVSEDQVRIMGRPVWFGRRL